MGNTTITISDETKFIIEKYGKMTVEELLEKTVAEIKKATFQGGNVSIAEAAKLMEKSQEFVRQGLIRQTLPFGHAVKMPGGKYSYHISPKLFQEYLGLMPKGIDENISNM